MAVTESPIACDRSGAFVRAESAFRQAVSADESTGFPAEAGRYHLYVSPACPWASRAVIVRMLKGLKDVISLSLVDPLRDERGWRFSESEPDPVNGFELLWQAYEATEPGYAGRVTVPVLWDRRTGRIVNNESAEIIRMLNSELQAFTDSQLDLYPADLRDEIDATNHRVYETVNNGVYRCGFARSQLAYERAFGELFDSLDWLERRLGGQRYLCSDERITEADWRLFTTLVRFDVAYHGHFKCNRRRLVDYPQLFAYARELFQRPGIAATVDFDQIKRHYYLTHPSLDPTGIVPAGPEVHFAAPHGRG